MSFVEHLLVLRTIAAMFFFFHVFMIYGGLKFHPLDSGFLKYNIIVMLAWLVLTILEDMSYKQLKRREEEDKQIPEPEDN